MIIRTYNEEQEAKSKEIQAQVYLSSSLTAAFISRAIAGKQIPSIGEVFSSFKEDEEQMRIEQLRTQMINFANRHNMGDK